MWQLRRKLALLDVRLRPTITPSGRFFSSTSGWKIPSKLHLTDLLSEFEISGWPHRCRVLDPFVLETFFLYNARLCCHGCTRTNTVDVYCLVRVILWPVVLSAKEKKKQRTSQTRWQVTDNRQTQLLIEQAKQIYLQKHTQMTTFPHRFPPCAFYCNVFGLANRTEAR